MATTDVDEATTETDDAPTVDDRDPATLVPAAVDEILELAQTWLAWDGAPVLSDGNAWTPLKALRRITDHLLDHLAEIEATLAGQPTVPDSWLGRTVTLESDWARFTEGDLNEASNGCFATPSSTASGSEGSPRRSSTGPGPLPGLSARSPTTSRGSPTTRIKSVTSPSGNRTVGPAATTRRPAVLLSERGRRGGGVRLSGWRRERPARRGCGRCRIAVRCRVRPLPGVGERGGRVRVSRAVFGQHRVQQRVRSVSSTALAGRGLLHQAAHVAGQQRHRVQLFGSGQPGVRQRLQCRFQPTHLVRAEDPGPERQLGAPRMRPVAGEDVAPTSSAGCATAARRAGPARAAAARGGARPCRSPASAPPVPPAGHVAVQRHLVYPSRCASRCMDRFARPSASTRSMASARMRSSDSDGFGPRRGRCLPPQSSSAMCGVDMLDHSR